MVTIRLTRRGGKNSPFYHVVVTDSRKRQGGTVLEQVGFYTYRERLVGSSLIDRVHDPVRRGGRDGCSRATGESRSDVPSARTR
ncbi:MAG: 30S ribosomal protein S16 [Sphingomonadales bacterium]|nr:30S ribosomal protein S16 [Sphingomonadales bacterium]